MKLSILTAAILLALAPAAVADDASRVRAATDWIDAVVHGHGDAPAPSSAHPVKLVFDSKAVFPDADSPCAKLRTATLTSGDQLAVLATCLRTAMHDQGLDDASVHTGDTVAEIGLRAVKTWFSRSLQRRITVPRGTKLIGATFDRPVGSDQEGAGVAVMVELVVDAHDRVVAVFAYAGHWSYPV